MTGRYLISVSIKNDWTLILQRTLPSSKYNLLYNYINDNIDLSLIGIGGHTMNNIMFHIINCMLLGMVKIVLDIQYLIPL